MKNNIDLIAEDILATRKFSRLDNKYVTSFIFSFLNKNKFRREKELVLRLEYKKLAKNASYKRFLKIVKRVLHSTYGVYQVKDTNKREGILKSMKKTDDKEKFIALHKEMLHTHSSSRERKEYYQEVYQKIFAICGRPNKILDVGCGMNPFSLIFMGFNNFEYIGMDFVERDINLINDYFNYFGKRIEVNGKAEFYNAFAADCPRITADVCFFLKMVDVIEYGSKSHKSTENFIKNIDAKFVVVSFATKTVSEKEMNNPRRKWFEVMLDRLGYSYDYFEVENECFYVVKK